MKPGSGSPSVFSMRRAGLLLALAVSPAALSSAAPVLVTAPTDLEVQVGETAAFRAEVNASDPVYQWFRDGSPIFGANQPTLQIARPNARDLGRYVVRVTDGLESVASGQGDVTAIAAGGWHTLFVRRDGSLWGVGSNGFGQLGAGPRRSSYSRPVLVAPAARAIAAGASHSLWVTPDGVLWGAGANGSGQLGDGSTTDRNTPVEIASGVLRVYAGTAHSLFIKQDGSLWGMGSNLRGELGDGSGRTRLSPVRIADGVTAAAAGGAHSLFLRTDGSLWGMGSNGDGQLALGPTRRETRTPLQIATGVLSLAAGDAHSLFVTVDGGLWSTGQDVYGQLGDGAAGLPGYVPVRIASGVTAAAAGGMHSLFIRQDGTLWTMGRNDAGQLGNGQRAFESATPTRIAAGVGSAGGGKGHSIVLRTDGSLWGSGYHPTSPLGIAGGRGSPTLELVGASVIGAELKILGLPVISGMPDEVSPGDRVELTASIEGTEGPFAYQWYRDGGELEGATSSRLVLPRISPADSGSYWVRLTSESGAVASDAVELQVDHSMLNALSVRTQAGVDDETVIAGVILRGETNKTLSIRGVGPTLSSFGVDGAMLDPEIRLYAGSTEIDRNNDWSGSLAISSLFPRLGLTPLPHGSRDAAMIPYVAPGAYTAHIGPADGRSGIALLEVYDASPAAYFTRLSAISVRAYSGSGARVLIVGISVRGNQPKPVVIRGVGPSLGNAIPGRMSDPVLKLYDSTGTVLQENTDWGGSPDIAAAFLRVGLAPLPASSRDAAIVTVLDPGVYTVQVTTQDNSPGIALLEVYELPEDYETR